MIIQEMTLEGIFDSKLGNGGFGSVYRVFDKILSVEKALKILEVNNPNEAYKLFSEAAIPYKCQHNNVIKINGGEIIQFNGELLFVIDMDLAMVCQSKVP